MTTWDCKPRTKVKLEILNQYLGAWFSIIASRFERAIYFDAFCGPGEYSTGEDGSPIIASRHASASCAANPEFRPTIILSDVNSGALSNLRSKLTALRPHNSVEIYIEDGGFEAAHKRVLSLRKERPNCPIFSFVDPFGIKAIPMPLINDLLNYRSSECFVNFMGGWANRFIDHPDADVATHVRNLLGGDFTQEVLLAGDKKRTDVILDIYKRQLSTRARYVHVFKMYDEGNVNDNALIFAGNDPRGFEKMKEAMWKLDPIYGKSFSAYHAQRTRSFGGDLFDNQKEPQTRLLGNQALELLTTRGPMSCQELFKWTIAEADYLNRHLRRELTRLYQENRITATDPEGTWRKGTWPPRIMVALRGTNG
jgi:three-Cys-motif partner protein